MIYVGNVPWKATDQDLANFFATVGKVRSAQIIIDRDTQRSRGFGFVEMENPADEDAAINQINGKELYDRALKVNKAQPKKPRSDDRNFRGRDR